jgi:hypothetical protein
VDLQVAAGQYECVYANMSRFGFALAGTPRTRDRPSTRSNFPDEFGRCLTAYCSKQNQFPQFNNPLFNKEISSDSLFETKPKHLQECVRRLARIANLEVRIKLHRLCFW